MPDHAVEEFQNGLAEGRRIVEAELAAERHPLSTLANALSDAFSGATLHLNPSDVAILDPKTIEVPVAVDCRQLLEYVRLTARAA